jgi:hypothetical protein
MRTEPLAAALLPLGAYAMSTSSLHACMQRCAPHTLGLTTAAATPSRSQGLSSSAHRLPAAPLALKRRIHALALPPSYCCVLLFVLPTGFLKTSMCMGVKTPVSPPRMRLFATLTSISCTSLRPCRTRTTRAGRCTRMPPEVNPSLLRRHATSVHCQGAARKPRRWQHSARNDRVVVEAELQYVITVLWWTTGPRKGIASFPRKGAFDVDMHTA